MKAEPSRLIPRKLIANLELIERKLPFKVAKQRKIRRDNQDFLRRKQKRK